MEILNKLKIAFINFMKSDPSKKFLENLTEEQKDLSSRIFDLAIGRVLKKAYLGLAENDKKTMEAVFLADNNKEKEEFIKKYIPDFKKIFKEETKEVEKEIIQEALKQNAGNT